jgi:hypothetical protein
MKYDDLSDLPEWDDDEFKEDDEEGEAWKPNPTRDACKALYQQWQQVMIVLNGALDSMKVEEKEDGFPADFWEDNKGMLLGDAYQVAIKIQSSETGGLYTIRMENASIIRKNAQFIKSGMLTLMAEEVIEEAHCYVIREEIDKFRELFKYWVSTFQKDEYEDEWGLFI